MTRALRISPAALEALAEHARQSIELDPENGRGYLDFAGTTYWAQVAE